MPITCTLSYPAGTCMEVKTYVAQPDTRTSGGAIRSALGGIPFGSIEIITHNLKSFTSSPRNQSAPSLLPYQTSEASITIHHPCRR